MSYRRRVEHLLTVIAADLQLLAARNHRDLLAVERAVTKEGDAMSVLSDKITEVGTSVDAATTRVVNDIAALNTKIAELQAIVDAGGATAEDIAALDALKVKLDQIDPATPTTI